MQKLTKKKKGLVFLFSFIIIFTIVSCHKKQILEELNISPSSPAITVTIIAQDSVQLSWTPATDPDGNVQGYNVYQTATSKSNYVKVNPTLLTGLNYTVTGLMINTRYYFVVRAVDSLGLESFSNRNEVSVCIGSNNNADLSNLTQSSPGILNPVFDSVFTSYIVTVTVPGQGLVTSIIITPTVADANATVKVNGILVASGTPSGSIPLSYGDNTITVLVTAQDLSTKTYTIIARRNYYPPYQFGVFSPLGVAVDTSGNIFIIRNDALQIKKYNPGGTDSGIFWGGPGSDDTHFNTPKAIAVDPGGNVYVADYGNNAIKKFDNNGVWKVTWASTNPQGIAIDSSGNIFVIENNIIKKYTSGWIYVTQWGGFVSPSAIALDNAGYVYVTDNGNNTIKKFGNNGVWQATWGTTNPVGVAVDSLGNIFVADSGNCRILKYNSGGSLLTQWGSYGWDVWYFDYPAALAIDSTNHLYVADYNNNRVQQWY